MNQLKSLDDHILFVLDCQQQSTCHLHIQQWKMNNHLTNHQLFEHLSELKLMHKTKSWNILNLISEKNMRNNKQFEKSNISSIWRNIFTKYDEFNEKIYAWKVKWVLLHLITKNLIKLSFLFEPYLFDQPCLVDQAIFLKRFVSTSFLT